MSYITFTYHQRNAPLLLSTIARLHSLQAIEIPWKKCLSTIQGLESRSFIIPVLSELQWNVIRSVLTNLPVWIKCGLKPTTELKPQLNISDAYDNLMELSCGYQASTTEYLWSQRIVDYQSLIWKTNIRQNYLAINYQFKELRLNSDCLCNYFIVSYTNVGTCMLILPLKASPRCYDLSRDRDQFSCRILDFGIIDKVCLANSSAICLQFPSQQAATACADFLVNVLKLDFHEGSINCLPMSNQQQYMANILSDFWSNYALQMLMTLGYRIKNKMTRTTYKKMVRLSHSSKNEQYPNHRCYLKLLALYYRARSNQFFDINEEFDNIQQTPPPVTLSKWEYVPRVYLTPYGVYPLPIKPMRGNRILRERAQFGPPENFCRVIIRDVDHGQPQNDFIKINQEWIKSLIMGNDYIIIGDRQFHFLLCSNSQLRDRSFWFHAAYEGRRAEDIRRWMGNFKRIKCVGTLVARMALSLTGTTETIKLFPFQIERIEDKFDEQGRIFTDGVGKISPAALEAALMVYNPELIKDNYMPCVIQARLNGIKGIFVLAPDLNNRGILIQYRPSQEKFKTNHNILEIVKHSSSGMAFLNQQVIVLLESMGVGQHIFLKLQNETRKKISMALLTNKVGQHTLEQHIRSYDWERMRKSGINLTKEPFVRRLLLVLAYERLKRLKDKQHVQIPLSGGRMLLGVVDETNSLQYGQVFIQLRDLKGQPHIIHKQKILITKNPAHYPGDVRIVESVDCPALHHLYECVVFPAQGKRPHPNEISGSDLDGDEYWVCWDDDLVNNAIKQHDPATFDSTKKTEHPDEITLKDIADFLFKYLSSDSLGVLSNRHLAFCALNGPCHPTALLLAGIISQAVDFPKTGVLPKIPSNIKIKQYPDFMENKHKQSFISYSSIGAMYRQMKTVWEMHSTWRDELEDEFVVIDENFLINGHEKFIDEAVKDYQYYRSKLDAILSVYNLENEYELITGCHCCVKEEKQNNNSAETALLEFRYLTQEMRKRFGNNNISYSKQLRKASAWYFVAYRAGTALSFGWIMNHLMSDIIKSKELPQEEHQALKRIGKAICHYDHEMYLRNLFSSYNWDDEDYTNFSETEKLGHQFLEIIDYCSGFANTQDLADKFLIFLHKVALNIL